MNDDELLTKVGTHFAADDPIPLTVARAARAAIEMRSLDADLAALLTDSFDEAALSAVRGTAELRLLGFRAGECTIDVELSTDGDDRQLLIQVLPAGEYSVTVERSSASARMATDAHGMLHVRGLPPGPLRILIERQLGDIRTEWFSV